MSVFDISATSVLLMILVVLSLKHAVSLFGKSALVDNAWNIYTSVASKAGHPKFVKLAEKRRELAKVNAERKAISAQDQYAKWTKLNRSFDQLSTEVTALVAEVSSEKASVSKAVNLAVTLVTSAPIWFSRYWYRKIVLFYFPAGVLPHYLEWVLALPFTVTGGLGLTVWMYAVNNVLSSLTFLISYMLEPAVPKPESPEKAKAESERAQSEKPQAAAAT